MPDRIHKKKTQEMSGTDLYFISDRIGWELKELCTCIYHPQFEINCHKGELSLVFGLW